MKGCWAVFAFCLVGLVSAENFENDVYQTIADWWASIEKEEDGFVSYFDLVDFFKVYDKDYDLEEDSGIFEIDENEFAERWAADFNVSNDAARAYFKRTDISQYFVSFLPERVTETDCLLWIDNLDIDEDGYLSEFEFILQMEYLYSDLLWGVMFIRYRTPDIGGDAGFGYNDAVVFDLFNNGDFQRIFDDIDSDADGFFSQTDLRVFITEKGYGSESFADLFFFTVDTNGDGFVDKLFEWSALYDEVDSGNQRAPLNYIEFTALDYVVRPFP